MIFTWFNIVASELQVKYDLTIFGDTLHNGSSFGTHKFNGTFVFKIRAKRLSFTFTGNILTQRPFF